MISPQLRRRFDATLDDIVAALPEQLHELLEEVPLVVEDEPSAAVLRDMDIDPRDTDLCGLHWGTPLTHRSVDQAAHLPDRMMLFRGPIIRVAEIGRAHV